eukprot:COSAG01_NODE_7737_length_3079_cov_2.034564_2_plen_100_part_00
MIWGRGWEPHTSEGQEHHPLVVQLSNHRSKMNRRLRRANFFCVICARESRVESIDDRYASCDETVQRYTDRICDAVMCFTHGKCFGGAPPPLIVNLGEP